MKKKVISALSLGVLMAFSVVCTAENTGKTMEQSVIRLHIRANSNTGFDQQLKLKVRDRILKDGKEIFELSENLSNARAAAAVNMKMLKSAAEDEIDKNGYDYPVRIRLGKEKFPSKHYGSIYFPAGTYEALVVDIGSGRGDNWWCVMFPPLCFVNESCERISPESEKVLKSNIGAKNYEILTDGRPAIKFKVYEMWKQLVEN